MRVNVYQQIAINPKENNPGVKESVPAFGMTLANKCLGRDFLGLQPDHFRFGFTKRFISASVIYGQEVSNRSVLSQKKCVHLHLTLAVCTRLQHINNKSPFDQQNASCIIESGASIIFLEQKKETNNRMLCYLQFPHERGRKSVEPV